MNMIYERIFKQLDRLTGGIREFMARDISSTMRFKALGFMDLIIEKIGTDRISMTHYFEMNGDLVPDPDMEIRIIPNSRMAEALTYQDQLRYQEVYPEPVKVFPYLKHKLNCFLIDWLENIRMQGFMPIDKGQEVSGRTVADLE